MRWLITGGLGFIGSAFVRAVIKTRPSVEVVNLDAMTYAANPANVGEVEASRRYRFVHGSIADAASVDNAIAEGVDAIVNFAAETHVDRSIHDAGAFLETNVRGTHVLLDAARERGVARYLHVSTDEVYGDVPEGASREIDPLRPRSPYAASKAAGDLLALAHHATYGTPVVVTRGSNTYGPYQHPEKLIPLCVTALLEGGTVPLYGDGLNERDWIHVDDHVAGILHVLEQGIDGNVYNVGGANGRTNRAVVSALADACERDFDAHVRRVEDRLGHDRRYCVDSAKLRDLGWRPQVDLERGLRETVQWYREHEDWWRPIKSGDFAEYYARQYGDREKL